MHIAIEYILCYSTAFLLGAFAGGLGVGYYYTDRHRKHEIISQRMKHIRRDNGRRKHAKS
jgi:hypothetical protein